MAMGRQWGGHQEEAPKAAGTQRLLTTRGCSYQRLLTTRGCSCQREKQKPPPKLVQPGKEALPLEHEGDKETEPASRSLSGVLTHRHELLFPTSPPTPAAQQRQPQYGEATPRLRKGADHQAARGLFGGDSHRVKRAGGICSRSLSASQRDSHADAPRALEAGCWLLGFPSRVFVPANTQTNESNHNGSQQPAGTFSVQHRSKSLR